MSARLFGKTTRLRTRNARLPAATRSAEPGIPALNAIIAAHPFFKGLSAAHIQVLTDSALPIDFVTGQTIFRRGDPANRFYLIETGKVVVELARPERKPVLIQTIGAGRELGWSWIIPPYYEHFTARVVEPTKAIFFNGTRLRECCEADHDLGYELMMRTTEVLLQRVEAASQILLEQSCPAPTGGYDWQPGQR